MPPESGKSPLIVVTCLFIHLLGSILDEAHFRFNTSLDPFCLEDANIVTYTTQAKPKAMVPTPPAEPPPGWATQLILVAYL